MQVFELKISTADDLRVSMENHGSDIDQYTHVITNDMVNTYLGKYNTSLEYANSGVHAADLSSINVNIVSSWAKTRRIFVSDKTVYQEGYDSAKWLPTYGGRLFFGLKNNLDKNWELTRVGSSNTYYVDIPAIYNNEPVVFLRCSSTGWGYGDAEKVFTSNHKTVHYWNKWETIFPNTFHSETYTVYSTDFATWEESSSVHSVYFVNSAFFNNVYD